MAKKTSKQTSEAQGSASNGDPTAKVFAGKVCSFTDAIKWAFRKHRSRGVRECDAPSEEAWAFFETFRECEAVDVLRFMDRLIPKQMPEEEKRDTVNDFDGRDLCEIYGDMVKEGV